MKQVLIVARENTFNRIRILFLPSDSIVDWKTMHKPSLAGISHIIVEAFMLAGNNKSCCYANEWQRLIQKDYSQINLTFAMPEGLLNANGLWEWDLKMPPHSDFWELTKPLGVHQVKDICKRQTIATEFIKGILSEKNNRHSVIYWLFPAKAGLKNFEHHYRKDKSDKNEVIQQVVQGLQDDLNQMRVVVSEYGDLWNYLPWRAEFLLMKDVYCQLEAILSQNNLIELDQNLDTFLKGIESISVVLESINDNLNAIL